jgi:hypothetical protein
MEPTLTLKAILEDNWDESNCARPMFYTPAEVKRQDLGDHDAITIYSVARTDTKTGLTNAYRTRVDTVSIDIVNFVEYNQSLRLRAEVERILDLPTVRSSPATRPNTGTFPQEDPYTAGTYDQIIPITSRTQEDRNRLWWRTIIDVELRSYWEAR